jgi:hypothetical protein
MVLAVVWAILVSVTDPSIKEFEIQNIEFKSLKDCDIAARQWGNEMANAAYTRGHRIEFGSSKRRAPAGVIATYSCVERERP